MRKIRTKRDLLALARELGVRPDWHEPDEQGVTITVHGRSFDNAGFWPKDFRYRTCEKYAVVKKDGAPVAAVNLATLFAWATGLEDE